MGVKTYSFFSRFTAKLTSVLWFFFIINRIRKVCEIVTAAWFGYSRFGGYEYGWLVYVQCEHQCMWQCKAMEMRLEFDPCPSRSAIEAAVDHLQHCYLSMRKPMVDSEGNFGGSRQIGVGERCDSVWTQVFGVFSALSLSLVTCFQDVWKGVIFSYRDGKLFWYSHQISNGSDPKKGLQALHPPKRESQVNSVNSIPFSGLPKFCSEASQVITFNASIKACGPCPGELRNRENQRSWSRMDLLRVLTLSPMFHVHIMLPLKISTKMCSLRQCHALRCAEWQEALHLFREVRVLSMEEGKLVSHGESWWFHDLIKRGRPVGLDVTLVVQYFLRKGTCSIIHGNSLFDMVVATQAFLTCYENHRRTKWHTLLWWVSVVCLGNGKECWSCWTLATCSHGCLNIYQPPKVLVFESDIDAPRTNREKPDLFETHRFLLRMGKLVSYQYLEGCLCSMALWCLWLWCPSWGCNASR